MTPTTELSWRVASVVAGSVQVDFSAAQSFALERRGERVDVHLQAERERLGGASGRSHSTVGGAGDRGVQIERVAPEVLVAEGVAAERFPAPLDRLHRVLDERRIRSLRARRL